MISNRFLLLCFVFLVAAQAQWQKFFVVVFDDAGYNSILSSSEWKSIMEDSFIAANYYALTYPTLPNLVAHLGGNVENCTESCELSQDSIIDLLEAQNLTWKAYIENYVPLDENGTCNMDGTSFSPFQNFPSITNNTNRCALISNETSFAWDVKMDSLSNFSYYRPLAVNKSVSEQASYFKAWLQNWYYPHTSTAFNNTLLMVTWSQDNSSADNQVIAFFKNPNLGKGASETKYNHYSIPKFLIDNFQLNGTLNATAEIMNATKNFGYELKSSQQQPPQNNTSGAPTKPKKGPMGKNPPPPPPSHGGNKKSTIALAIAIPAVLLAIAFGIWAFRKRKVAENANNTKRFGPTTNSRLIEARQDSRELTSAFYLGE